MRNRQQFAGRTPAPPVTGVGRFANRRLPRKSAGQVLADNGAREILACATHPVLSGPAIERMDKSVFSQILVTDTIPLDARKKTCKKIKVLSVAELLAQAIVNVHGEASVSVLFV